MPEGWSFNNESFPSDHSIWRWANPDGSGESIELYGSGCAGCVQGPSVTKPKPTGGLPEGARAGEAPTACTLNYDGPLPGETLASGKPADRHGLPAIGRVTVTNMNGTIDGFYRITVWLRAEQKDDAQAVVDSFRLSGSREPTC